MGGNGFPSIGAPKLKRILCKKLGYREVPDSGPGSHCWLESETHTRVRWAFHDSREVTSIEVRRLLVTQIGLSNEEARRLVT